MEHLCDEIAILHDTKVVGVGDIDTLRQMFGRKREVYLEIGSRRYDDVVKAVRKNLIQESKVVDNRLLIYTDKEDEVLKEVMAYAKRKKESVINVGVRQPSLNEIFEGLTGKKR